MLTIINKSQKIFDGLIFTRIEDQSHGESDYIDNKGQLYDAKLLFDKKQSALIGDAKNDFKDWLQAMLDEKTEFGESIKKRDLSFLPTTRLYLVMKERLASVKLDENVIFSFLFQLWIEFYGTCNTLIRVSGR